MPHFTIIPRGSHIDTLELLSADATPILQLLEKLQVEEADVLREQQYDFSVRLSGPGFWVINSLRLGNETAKARLQPSPQGTGVAKQ